MFYSLSFFLLSLGRCATLKPLARPTPNVVGFGVPMTTAPKFVVCSMLLNTKNLQASSPRPYGSGSLFRKQLKIPLQLRWRHQL